MELKLAFLVAIICVVLFSGSDAEIVRRKSIKIHVPLEVRHHKHTHTIVKNIHHCHKPRKPLKDITSQDLKHEHVHHHYRDEDSQLLTINENAFMPSSSNRHEKVVYNDNLVNIENEALESLAVLQSSVNEVKAPVEDVIEVAASSQDSSSTKLPAVARSRTHVHSRRRAPNSRTTTTRTTTTTEEPTTAAAESSEE